MITHRHVCTCGAEWHCAAPADQCPIRYWDCPVCEGNAIDNYFASLLEDTQPQPTQEQTREHQQRIS